MDSDCQLARYPVLYDADAELCNHLDEAHIIVDFLCSPHFNDCDESQGNSYEGEDVVCKDRNVLVLFLFIEYHPSVEQRYYQDIAVHSNDQVVYS